MHDGEVIEGYVREGRLDPLTAQNLEAEREGLLEDLLNWDNQHPMVVVYGESRQKEQYH